MKRYGLFLLVALIWSAPTTTAQNPPLPSQSEIRSLLGEIRAENLQRHVEALSSIHSRHIASPHIEKAWRYIYDEFKKIDGLEVELDEFSQQIRRLGNREVRMVNVVATLRGKSDPQRHYVVSGHYDSRASDGRDFESRAPGAVDDASGTAMVLELARVMASRRFDATVVFIAFSGEEVGLLGSSHWAQKAREQDLDIDAMITNDIVGNSHGGGGHFSRNDMRVFSEGVPVNESERQARLRMSIGGEVDYPARQLARFVQEIGQIYQPEMSVHLIYRRDRFGRGGDHTPFSRVGYPGVRFSEMYENYFRQHQDIRSEDGVDFGDVPEFFDSQYAARICRVNAAVLATLADAPPPPKNVRIGGALRYDTSLSWDPVAADDLDGYYILVRETSSPVWQRRITVGNVTEYVLKGVIVDNSFFAVQSVDRSGHASLPVFPSGRKRRR